MPALSSCKKEVADTSDLLSTVPSSAGVVVGVNLKSVLEKAGCKVDGSDITPGGDVQKWIDGQKGSTDSQREAMKLVLSGESGIDPVGAIFFTDAYNSYLTAMLADTSKFLEFVKKQTGKEFTETDGVKICGNIAVEGAQMWICISSSDTIDPKAIKNYSSLEQAQSFMTNSFAGKISNMTNDLIGWAQIKSFSGSGMSFGDMAKLNMFAAMLFENATSVSFTYDFLKGKMEGSAVVLNDKGEPAKYLLPADKIDVDKVKALASNAELVGAVSITKDLMKKIENVSSSLGGNMFGVVLNMLGSLDGTVAVALSSLDFDNMSQGISGVITTDGNPSPDLMSLLSNVAPPRKDGNLVKFSSGVVSGGLDVARAADFLKGATLGVVINAGASDLGGKKDGFKTVAMSLNPEKNGIVLKVMVTGIDEDENMLLTMLKNNK